MDNGSEMRDTAFDWDRKNRRFRVGASVPRCVAAVVLGLAGGSAVIPSLIRYLLP